MATKRRETRSPQFISFVGWVGGSLAVGSLGGLVTYEKIPGWYATLTKPVFTPPNWLFGPVWTLLYILMGYAMHRVWVSKTDIRQRRRVARLFLFQLLLNFLWSYLFFGQQNIIASCIEIVVLWLAIAALIRDVRRIDTTAALLLMPYFLWTSFAMILNYSLWVLNV